ncbi:MAG TPA: hypothetical protein VFW80_02950 [Gaiellaceae bacterium]|nr:hypothetical protein [Gaiellaceae bacterium]
MASKKAEAALLKQKEAKQKKVLFLLVPVFIALIGWQGPKTFKALTGGDPPPPPATAAPATATTVPTPGSAPSTPGAGTAVPPGQLVDTDAPPSPLDGQLTNFSVFPGRDPFSGGTTTAPQVGTTTGTDTTQAATPSSAQIEINGQVEAVSASGTFPSSDPIFKLVSLTSTSVTLGLASGKNFTNGDPTETIKTGETLTVAGDDGSSFSIKLVSVSSN